MQFAQVVLISRPQQYNGSWTILGVVTCRGACSDCDASLRFSKPNPARCSTLYPSSQLVCLLSNGLATCANHLSQFRQPWHGRSLVTLPTTQRLGLENFTVFPVTPPLRFLPIRVRDDDNKFALRGDGSGDDLSQTPYLTALANKATRTVSLKIVYLPTPLRESFETQIDDCPEGYDCIADQWMFDEDSSGDGQVLYNMQFAGFKGKWFPFKDAGKEGWHVYWKGDFGEYISINFDLVPLPQDGRGSD